MCLSDGKSFRLTKYACYATNVSMAAISTISPLLFVTYREMYGISYTLLGLLVVINFSTQLCVDLIFTLFSKYFNPRFAALLTPVLTIAGLFIYAILPGIFPDTAYLWLAVGTFVFSAASGLSEVLMSPIVAAIPADNPEREMSKLHSVYAWGLVGVVIFGAAFLHFAGDKNWQYLALAFAIIPMTALILFLVSPFPNMQMATEKSEGGGFPPAIFLCVFCIFLGGAAECTMTQWISGYMENALGVPKLIGDVCGMAAFAFALALGRSLYAARGKNILGVMTLGMAGAAVCYLLGALSGIPVIGLVACVLTGFCVSMLWPGNIILVGEKFPSAGVAAYALMAAGGDLGASVAPQLLGIIADGVGVSDFAQTLGQYFGMSAEQIGMRSGMLVSALFPLIGFVITLIMKRKLSGGGSRDKKE
jgi:MFS family permease